MAYYEDALLDGDPGSFIAMLDAYLPLNPYWSIYDDGFEGSGSAEFQRVYRCYDYAENCDFFFYVNNTYSDLAYVELWEGWDITTHSGVGSSLTGYAANAIRIGCTTGQIKLCVGNHRLIYVSAYWDGYYIGQPRRVDESKNIVLIAAHGNTPSTTTHNPIAYFISAASSDCRCLFDEGGGQSYIDHSNALTYYNYLRKRIGGTYSVFEDRLINRTTELVIGWFDGVSSLGSADTVGNGLGRGDTVTVDGVSWILTDGVNASTKYLALVRQD